MRVRDKSVGQRRYDWLAVAYLSLFSFPRPAKAASSPSMSRITRLQYSSVKVRNNRQLGEEDIVSFVCHDPFPL